MMQRVGTPTTGVMALHGVDYEALPGVLTIPAGSSQTTVTIMPRYDTLGEGSETVVFTLGAGSTNFVLGSPSTATVTIADGASDVPYVDVVNTASAAEPSTNGNFRITLRGGAGTGTVNVNYTISGTATGGVDFTALTGTAAITLADGATVTTNISVAPLADSDLEDLENVTLTITANAAYQTYAKTSTATMWLRDDDQPTVYVDTQVGTERELDLHRGGRDESGEVLRLPDRQHHRRADRQLHRGWHRHRRKRLHRPRRLDRDPGRRAWRGCARRGHQRHPLRRHGNDHLHLRAQEAYSRSAGTVMYLADNDTATRTLGFQAPGSSGLGSVTSVDIPVTLSVRLGLGGDG